MAAPTIEEYHTALTALVDALEIDVNGVNGMPLSGNGGLVSDATMKERTKSIRVVYAGRKHLGLK